MLKNAYLLSKIGADSPENEPKPESKDADKTYAYVPAPAFFGESAPSLKKVRSRSLVWIFRLILIFQPFNLGRRSSCPSRRRRRTLPGAPD